VSTYGPGGADHVDGYGTSYAITTSVWPSSASFPTSTIQFNVQHSSDPTRYRAWLGIGDKMGYGVGDTPSAVALHEFGHAVNNYDRGIASGRLVDQLRKPNIIGQQRMSKLVSNGISDYAATNPSELMAEVFADVMVNGDDAHDLSRQLFPLIEDRYRARVALDERERASRLKLDKELAELRRGLGLGGDGS